MPSETTYTNARANLAKLCQQVTEDRDVVIIRRRGHEDVAIVSASELESISETAHLLRSPTNRRRLLRALDRAKARKLKPQSVDRLRREVDLGRKLTTAPSHVDCLPSLREGEKLVDYICRVMLAVYEIERSHLGSHSATAHRLGMNRNTLYDWLEWAQQHTTK